MIFTQINIICQKVNILKRKKKRKKKSQNHECSLLTLVAFCSVATAFAVKLVRFRLFKKLSLKFNDGVGTLLKFIFNDRNLWRRVSRSIFSGV